MKGIEIKLVGFSHVFGFYYKIHDLYLRRSECFSPFFPSNVQILQIKQYTNNQQKMNAGGRNERVAALLLLVPWTGNTVFLTCVVKAFCTLNRSGGHSLTGSLPIFKHFMVFKTLQKKKKDSFKPDALQKRLVCPQSPAWLWTQLKQDKEEQNLGRPIRHPQVKPHQTVPCLLTSRSSSSSHCFILLPKAFLLLLLAFRILASLLPEP